jgi:hypothetical protein
LLIFLTVQKLTRAAELYISPKKNVKIFSGVGENQGRLLRKTDNFLADGMCGYWE